MKLLKTLGLLILVIIAIPLIIGLFLPKNYGVNEEIVIDLPIEEVYDYAKLLENQKEFSKWQLMDPSMEHYHEGEDGTVGFISGWRSDNPDVGSGEQEIIGITPMERIDYELRFLEPFESTSNAFMSFQRMGDNQTQVNWGFEGEMGYPMNIMIPLIGMEKMISDDLQTGLQNLKSLLEK
jgi:uncharacterized membrane protein